MRRPFLVGALTGVLALSASAAVAVGPLDGPSSGPSTPRGLGTSMMSGTSTGTGMMGTTGTGTSMMGTAGTGTGMMGSRRTSGIGQHCISSKAMSGTGTGARAMAS